MARRPCSAPAKGRAQAHLAGAQVDADRKLQLIAGLHSQKVASLLNSQNRLQCENAQLRKQELEYRRSSKRGPAFLRAETELSRQDAMIRELSSLLTRDVARSAARAALTAGPRRVAAKTRLELTWDIEDEQEKLISVQEKIASHAQRSIEEANKPDTEAPISMATMKERLADLKRNVSNLLLANQTHQVENASLERVLERGAELFVRLREQQPNPGGVQYGASALGDRLLKKQEELVELQRTRTDLEKTILQINQDIKNKEAAKDSKVREIERLRHKAIEAKKDADVFAQGQLLREQKKAAEKLKELQGAQGRLKAVKGEKQIGIREREQRRSQSLGDNARQELVMRREAHIQLQEDEEEMKSMAIEAEKDYRHSERSLEMRQQDCLEEYKELQKVEQEIAQAQNKQKPILENLMVAQQQEEQALAQTKESIQAAKAEREEQLYLEDELKDLDRQLASKKQRHAAHDKELASELKALQRSLQIRVSAMQAEEDKVWLTRHVSDKNFAADLDAQVAKEKRLAAERVSKVHRELEIQRGEFRVQEEAVQMRRTARDEREEAASMIKRFNAQQELLLIAQREREAAARDLRKAKVQIERWILEHSVAKQHADAEWDRAAAIADLEWWSNHQGSLAAAAEERSKANIHLEEVQAQRSAWVSELQEAAAKERSAAGKDIAVVRAQIQRWNALQAVGPATQLPDLTNEALFTDAQLVDYLSHTEMRPNDVPSVSIVHQPASPPPHLSTQRPASDRIEPHDVPLVAEQELVLTPETAELQGLTTIQEAIQGVEAELAEERRLSQQQAQRCHEAPADANDELNYLLSRAAELEDGCLGLEQRHAMLEQQVKAARVLIRRLQNRAKDTASRGCPHCSHCRDLYRSKIAQPGRSEESVT